MSGEGAFKKETAPTVLFLDNILSEHIPDLSFRLMGKFHPLSVSWMGKSQPIGPQCDAAALYAAAVFAVTQYGGGAA